MTLKLIREFVAKKNDLPRIHEFSFARQSVAKSVNAT
jgi:hypothetical protein